MELDSQTRGMLKEAMGMTDAELDQLTPNVLNGMASVATLAKYKFIAECIESQYCAAGVQKGQKFVFSSSPPIILPESDCPTCLRALGPITNVVNIMIDRAISGLDPEPAMFPYAACLDPGVGRGGFGHTVFKVYAQEME